MSPGEIINEWRLIYCTITVVITASHWLQYHNNKKQNRLFVTEDAHNEAIAEGNSPTVKPWWCWTDKTASHNKTHSWRLQLIQPLCNQKVCNTCRKCMVLENAGSSRSCSSRHAQTPKHATQQHIATCNPQSWAEPNAAAAAATRQHERRLQLQSRGQAHRSSTASSPASGLSSDPRPLSLAPSPEVLPDAGRRVHLDVTARRRAGFPLLSVRHASRSSCHHWLRCSRPAETPEKSADAAIVCCLWGLWEKWQLNWTVQELWN